MLEPLNVEAKKDLENLTGKKLAAKKKDKEFYGKLFKWLSTKKNIIK